MRNGFCRRSSIFRCATSGFVLIASASREQPKGASSTSASAPDLIFPSMGDRPAKSSDSIHRRACRREPSARRSTWKFPSTSSKVRPNASRWRTAAWTRFMTWTGCSIPEIRTALMDMRRVLKIGGRLLFVEHGRAPEPSVARWQDRLNPLWLRFSGGCHLNRKIDDLLAEAGFRLDRLETGYIAGPRIMTFLYEGAALPR